MGDPEVIRVGVILSEVDDCLERAMAVVGELGLSEVELSLVDGVPVQDLSLAAMHRTAEQIRRAGLRVPVIGTELFKAIEVDDADGRRTHMAGLGRALAAAREFGADVVRLYAFRRAGIVGLGNPSPILPDGGPVPADVLAKVADALQAAGDLAGELGLTVAVENVRSCWANSGVNTGRIVAAADHRSVAICWDPANDLVAGGDPAGSGYSAVRARIIAAHLKDVAIVDPLAGLTAWRPIGQGCLDVVAQLRLLARDGFAGLASLETHWRTPAGSKADGTRISFSGLMDAVEAAAPMEV